MIKADRIPDQKPPKVPASRMLLTKESSKSSIDGQRSKSGRSSSFLVRSIDKITGRRPGLSRFGSNSSSLTDETLSDKRVVRFCDAKKNKVHMVAARRQLEPMRSEIWYTVRELHMMNEAAAAAVYYSDSIQKYADTCASFHRSLAMEHKQKANSKSPLQEQRPPQQVIMQAPRIMQEGLNYGYRGLEMHCEAGSYRHSFVSRTVRKVVKADRKKSSSSDEEENQDALAKLSMKLTQPSRDYAALLAQLDIAAMDHDFDSQADTLSEADLELDDLEGDDSTLLYL